MTHKSDKSKVMIKSMEKKSGIASDNFEALFDRITSIKSRKAADLLFSSSPQSFRVNTLSKKD